MDDQLVIDNIQDFKSQFDFFSKIVIGNFWFKDVNGVYLGCNDTVAKLLGFKDQTSIIGKTDYELPWKENAERLIADDNKVIISQKPHQFEEKAFSNGKHYTFMVTKVPLINHDRKTVGTIGISVDITQDKLFNNLSKINKKQKIMLKKEQEIKKEQEKLNFFMRKDSIKEAVLGIAHEVNQPLAAISAYLNGCLKRFKNSENINISDDIVLALTRAELQAQRAGNIIHSVKNLLTNQAVNKKETNINALIDKTCYLLENSLDQFRITLEKQFEEKLPLILSDETQISQVIFNVLNNAIDAIKTKSEIKKIICRTALNTKNEILITIIDTGCGIEKENLDDIFLPFYTTKNNGSGIGLALSYHIIEQHNGKIYAATKNKEGTQINIVLPI